MKTMGKLTFFICMVLVICLFSLLSCSDSKPAEDTKVNLVVTEQNFFLDHFTESSWMVIAEGKVTNQGPVDVKNVVITGYCSDCEDKWIPGKWFNTEGEKMPEQTARINYLPVGASETFKFPDVALLMGVDDKTPAMPERFEIVIKSYEPVSDI